MADSAPSPSVADPYLVQNYNRNAVRFVRGSGCHLEDDRGTRYLDAFAGSRSAPWGTATRASPRPSPTRRGP